MYYVPECQDSSHSTHQHIMYEHIGAGNYSCYMQHLPSVCLHCCKHYHKLHDITGWLFHEPNKWKNVLQQ